MIVTYFSMRGHFEQQEGNRLKEIVLHSAKVIDNFMFARVADFNVLSNNPLFSTSSNKITSQYLLRVVNEYPFYENLFFVNKKGIILSSSDQNYIGLNILKLEPDIENEFNKTINGGNEDVFISDIYNISQKEIEEDSPLDIELLSDVIDLNGNVVGVLVGFLSIPALHELIFENNIQKSNNQSFTNTYTSLLNNKGIVLMSDDKKATILQPHPDLLISDLQQKVEKGKNDFYFYKNSKNLNVISGYASLSGYGTEGVGKWFLLTTTPYKELMKPVSQMIYKVFFTFLLMALAIIIFLIYFSKTLSKPIVELEQAVSNFRVTKKPINIKSSNIDEIGSLTRSFNIMTKNLYSSYIIEHNLSQEKNAVKANLRHFINTANAPIFGMDRKGMINEWNKTAEKITGYKKSEVMGQNLIKNYIDKDYRLSIKKVLFSALKGKETDSFEFKLRSKEGKNIIILLNSSTSLNAKGEIIGVLGVGQEITKLIDHRNELELRVKERTLKLEESLNKEKELSELKSRFVSTASHEFRTPLSAINFAAGSIKKYWAKMEPIMIEKKLNKIENQVQHMTNLLDDILIVGQADAGEISNKPIHINLGDFIDDIIEDVYKSYKKSHLILLIDTEELKSSDIFIDKKVGRNIFINLLSNAIKFSPDANKATVELSSEKDNTIISVTDFGIGIPESELKNIFKPFTRGKNVDLIQGTGLGLSIVKEAIHSIGGELILKSKVGKGSSFIVKIPKNK